MNEVKGSAKAVLVTGATGAIGGALVPLFLREKDSRVFLIVRAENDVRLRARLDELLAFWEIGADDHATRSRITAFRGDVCRERLGLSETDAQRLHGTVTHIIHCAGNVRLNLPIEEARRHAVDGVRNILDFARECERAGRLPKLDAVSTVGVAGRTPGLIHEEPMTKQREFHNTYEAAKADGEAVLLEGMKRGLRVTIHRPSMVIGDSKSGRIAHFQVFYYLGELISGRKTLGLIPELGGRKLDVIPVDYVARAIWISANRHDSAGRIFHLCSGPGNELDLEEHALRMKELLAQTGPRLRGVSLSVIAGLLPILKLFSSAKNRRALATIPAFLSYLGEEQHYGNRATRRFFEQAGLNLPAVEDYLPRVMDYYMKTKYGTGSRTAPSPLLPAQGAHAKSDAWIQLEGCR